MLLSSRNKPSGQLLQSTMSTPWYPPLRPSYFVMDAQPSNSREQRNKAEKQRRDRLNSFIGELATLVPMVAKSAKRMDKTSILRLTATYLRIYQTLINRNVPHMQFPKHIDQFLLEQLVCEQLGGFLLIVIPTGKIVFISHTVETLLGHLQTDLMGQSLFNITSPDDHDRLRMFLQCETIVEQDWKKDFNIRLKRAGPRSESAVYEPVRMMGMYRSSDELNDNIPMSSSSSTSSTSSNVNNNDIMVFFVKVHRPEPLLERLMEASKDEYVTRHLIDGRIINCDQRISIVAGYMIEEISGHSAFKYMHRDDVRWVMIALRQMYDRGESRGSSCYRLQSRNGQFIFLRTFGFLEIDNQGTVESFVCVNTLVSEAEGLQLIDDMKKKYAALINNAIETCEGGEASLTPPPSNDSIDLVEDPQEVDLAVAHLMHNLPSPGSDNNRSTPSPSVQYENQDCTTHLTNVTTENSPNKIYRPKTVTKRPPGTEIHFTNANGKRLRTTPTQASPLRRTMPPYSHRSPIISDMKPSIYTQEELLRQNF